MPDTPYNEPSAFMAGDTITWLKTVDDYPPASGWALSYVLRSAANHYHVSTTTSGTDYLATITAIVSAAYVAATYTWIAYVTKGGEQHTIGQGTVVVQPNLTADGLVEARTESRIIYDSLITATSPMSPATGP